MAKILHISNFYHPHYGGIEVVARTIVSELKPYHEQRIIAYHTAADTVDEVVDDIPITRIGVCAVLFSQPMALRCRRQIQRVINVFRPDFIHLHLPNPLVATMLLCINLRGAKIVSHWHSDVLGKGVLYTLYRPFEKMILERSEKILATSEQYLLNSKPLEPYIGTKAMVLPNTFSEEKLNLQDGDAEKIVEIKRRWGKKIVLSVGRHVAYKGLKYLIAASEYIHSDVEIIIVGDGPETVSLKHQAQGHNNIHFLGSISDDELRCYFHAADLFAFPSVTKAEAFGIALAEALYCGKPAVSFDVQGSGISWVNKHDVAGRVVSLGDVKGYAAAIDEILGDETLYARLSKSAHDWVVKNFSNSLILPILEQVYGKTESMKRGDIDLKGVSRLLSDKTEPMKIGDAGEKLNVSVVLYRNKFEEVSRLVELIGSNVLVNEIFVVDNTEVVDERYKSLNVTYIHTGLNLGYGKGHNEAIYKTLADNVPFHLTLNADVQFEASVLDKVIHYMEQHSDVAALMPKVYYPDGKVQYLCRLLPTPIDLIGRRFLFNALMKNRLARLEMRFTDYNHTIDVPHVSGCFMLLRSDCLRTVGLFDPRYFLYMEDVDFTRRLHQQYRTVFYPEVSIVHEHKQGSYKEMRLLCVHMKSAIQYFNKWGWLKDDERTRVNQSVMDN